MDKLAANLTTLRKINGYTQNDISSKLFVSRQAVSKWERGESLPDVDTLLALSELYHVSVDDMLKKEMAEESITAARFPEKNFDELKQRHKSQLTLKMLFVSLCFFGIYALICGIVQTACFNVQGIWLIWFTLPIVPPLLFLIVFIHYVQKRFWMFFFNVSFVCAIIFELIIYSGNPGGAWITFLLIPVYYAIALIVCFCKRSGKTKK